MQFIHQIKSLFFGSVVLTQCLLSQETLLLMDMSGSMYGDIDQSNKIEKARQYIQKLLDAEDSSYNYGLHIVGGMRYKGCKNEKIVIPIAANTQTKILHYIQTHEPRGKTPLARSFLHAVKAFKSADDARIILVSDGRERCGNHACESVDTIQKRYPHLKIDIMSLATDKKGLSTLQCIIEKSGGRFLNNDPLYSVVSRRMDVKGKTRSTNLYDTIKSTVRLYAALPIDDQAAIATHHIYTKQGDELAQCQSLQNQACQVILESGIYRVETLYQNKKHETKLHVLSNMDAYLYTNFRISNSDDTESVPTTLEEPELIAEQEVLEEEAYKSSLMNRMLRRRPPVDFRDRRIEAPEPLIEAIPESEIAEPLI